ncbi:peptidoglycan-binding LysM domain-containing protein [Artemisia annua]|uniref:Peptidoglycan-binding LysM domain-containing protein n=1 Tax=Artemisia annua TaxID=35608 RepID=A0A2U1LRW5_ARTAN|nr:peptidoglycan-binding LysM domain-containing protein [Artemisia annua]
MASSRSPVCYADAARWYCLIFLVLLVVLGSFTDENSLIKKMNPTAGQACDEIYVVGEGETLHTISDKCGDAFIVEENPHIHDPDDVFPGLVIKITPSRNSRS